MKMFYNGTINFIEKYYWFFFAAMVAVTGFLCFRCLDVAYVSSWDEARHGVSAYEMMQSGNYVVNTFGYEPDYWNLKPPLSFYGIMLGFKIFGYSVMGLRFYSALAYLVTCIGIGLFLKKYHKLTSLIGMCFLCCNYHILGFHCARSGDADALFLMFFVFSMLSMLEIPQKHSRLYVCGFCFACAFLSKSFHAGVIAGIGGLYLLLTGIFKEIRWKEWIGFVLSFAVPLGIWGIARASQDGVHFFKEMILTDVLSRTSSASEGHAGNFWFYFDTYFKDFERIYPYLLIFIAVACAGCLMKMILQKEFKKEIVREVFGYGLWLLLPFLFFSMVSTKLVWYGYPVLIPLEVISAILLGRLLTKPFWGNRNVIVFGKAVIALGAVYLAATQMYGTYLHAVREIHGDEMQMFIAESVERDSEYAGKNAYIDASQEMEDGTVWNQHVRFLAEISGDFYCKDGGLQKFLKEKDAVLYIDRERYAQNRELLEEYEILYEKGNYVLLK